MEHSERRDNDARLLRVEDKLLDQDKAITTLVSNHQAVSFTLAKIQETLGEISATLKKQVEIEKQLVKYEIIEKDYGNRLKTIEDARSSTGCHHMVEVKKQIKELQDDKKWLFRGVMSALGLAILGLLGLHK